jgi:DNA-binding NarL/FixJ family response regulator
MGEKIRIAIADENAAFRAAAADFVARLPGCVLAGTAAAGEAQSLARHAEADVLLLDLGPAPARGMELLRQVRALAGAPAIVAMTLFSCAEVSAAARGAGAAGLVGKDSFVPGLLRILAALHPAKAA